MIFLSVIASDLVHLLPISLLKRISIIPIFLILIGCSKPLNDVKTLMQSYERLDIRKRAEEITNSELDDL